jgi:hypothetical protein
MSIVAPVARLNADLANLLSDKIGGPDRASILVEIA